MTTEQHKLWDKIEAFKLDNPASRLSFTDRLCRENGWSKKYAERAVMEYKRFMFLCATAGRAMTPSDEVDQVWHLHLIYSYSYWEEFCGEVLGGIKIHHGPTKGGQQERTKYSNQYQDTLDFYKEKFDENAPEDIWPKSEVRFSKINFMRVDMHDNYVLNKSKVKQHSILYAVLLVGFFIGLFFMSATGTETSNNSEFLGVVIGVILLVFVIFVIRGIYRYVKINSDRKIDKLGKYGRGSSYSYKSLLENKYQMPSTTKKSSSDKKSDKKNNDTNNGDGGCSAAGAFLGCSGGHDSGCSSSGGSGCGSSCGSSCGGGCGGCGG